MPKGKRLARNVDISVGQEHICVGMSTSFCLRFRAKKRTTKMIRKFDWRELESTIKATEAHIL